MLTTSDLRIFLETHAVGGEILQLDSPTPTVQAAAEAVGAHPDQIVKSILFVVDEQLILAIACGTDRIDRRAIAGFLGVGRKRVKLAEAGTVLHMAGYEVGAMPPFAHRHPIKTLLDRRVLEQPLVYAGGGAENALMRLAPSEILRVTQARVLDLIDPDASGSPQ
ncbi:MAG: YbaK/EbsC family protein [Anaerolineales bacterium]|nr:MAG: YbaK/EbsC family protein [Anaerolineales bacterium]